MYQKSSDFGSIRAIKTYSNLKINLEYSSINILDQLKDLFSFSCKEKEKRSGKMIIFESLMSFFLKCR